MICGGVLCKDCKNLIRWRASAHNDFSIRTSQVTYFLHDWQYTFKKWLAGLVTVWAVLVIIQLLPQIRSY